MSALFTIYDQKGEPFEVQSHRLAALRTKGWSDKAPVSYLAPAPETVEMPLPDVPVEVKEDAKKTKAV